ncbi:DUF6456 domain-containing protein [Oceaniglobus indicus]|uniref:DUF6456 domain-containing protein n=1 Tax=Oceaniglobus indicus TaxID=2047749 RepID=UPI000C17F1C5|nr:DUF6456 domain-containing protein [Oceaniglobus indicus]
MPDWVPSAARVYLAHTEQGTSIRALARAEGCHASTVLRRVRRVEQRRDDPLVDLALRRLGAGGIETKAMGGRDTEPDAAPLSTATEGIGGPNPGAFEREAKRVLRRLAEPGACLAIADGMENAVVVREAADGQTVRTAIVHRPDAEAMALKGWIVVQRDGKITRYVITAKGRAALTRMLDAGNPARSGATSGPSRGTGRVRYGLPESPVLALSRRKGPDGAPFLSETLVSAAERLREDFELAQSAGIAPTVGEMLPVPDGRTLMSPGADMARIRVARALFDLGPGLADVVLRCCCQLEGMETVERRMGWAARSGKIVLRIALQRLRRYFDEVEGKLGPMIG